MDFYSTTHISYNNAGIDTDTIVQKLMQAEQVPLDQLKQKQQKDLWLSDAYRQWNTDIFSFNNDTVFNMKMSSSYDTFNVTTVPSTDNSVTGTGTASAIPGTYNLVVKALATSATLKGNTTFKSTDDLLPASTSGTNADGSLDINISTNDPTNGTQTGKVHIPKDATIADVVSAFNSVNDSTTGKRLGVTAYYDSNLNQFIVKTNSTGSATKIDVSNNTGEASTFLTNTLGLSSTTNQGIDADIFLNGNEVKPASNNVTLLGVNYTLNNVNTQTNPNGTTIAVSQNIDSEVKNIEDFVSKYNDILGKLNSAISEPVYTDYQPLTDDQKSQMTDTQVQQWETKAKSGLMHNDSILSDLVNKMRSTMTSFVNNGSSYNSLASIGITSHSYQDQGKLYVDETKLRAALQVDPQGVKNLFSQLGDGVGNQAGKQGIVQSLSDNLNDAFTQLVTKAGSTSGSQYDQSFLGQVLANLNTQISDMTTKLQSKEKSYYQQYDAMQVAVSKYQSQGSWLSQQLGAGSTTSG